MKTENILFTESTSDDVLLESGLSDLSLYTMQSLVPDGDEKDDNDEEEDMDDEEYKSDDQSSDDPPLDKGVVHSPVTTQPGGVPKKG